MSGMTNMGNSSMGNINMNNIDKDKRDTTAAKAVGKNGGAVRAVSLTSGGLDSLLATRIVMDLGIDVLALHCITPFFGTGPGLGFEEYSKDFKEKMVEMYGIRSEVIDVTSDFIKMVGNPAHGYGKNFNPCLDCKILLVSEAKKYIDKMTVEGGKKFIVTGEVLGQRPMSQRRDTMRIVERESKSDGVLLRPLSAKLLEPTVVEVEGYVDRDALLEFSGRTRKPQMALAESMGIEKYQTPAGGCCLTDPIISKRIKRLYEMKACPTTDDIYSVRVGRPFLLKSGGGGVILTIGRDEVENSVIEKMGNNGALFVKLVDLPGPLGLLRGDFGNDEISLAISILARYSKARNERKVRGAFGSTIDTFDGEMTVGKIMDNELEALRF